jgi:hypothetical protein
MLVFNPFVLMQNDDSHKLKQLERDWTAESRDVNNRNLLMMNYKREWFGMRLSEASGVSFGTAYEAMRHLTIFLGEELCWRVGWQALIDYYDAWPDRKPFLYNACNTVGDKFQAMRDEMIKERTLQVLNDYIAERDCVPIQIYLEFDYRHTPNFSSDEDCFFLGEYYFDLDTKTYLYDAFNRQIQPFMAVTMAPTCHAFFEHIPTSKEF